MNKSKNILKSFKNGFYNFNKEGEPLSFKAGYMIGGFSEAFIIPLNEEAKLLEAIELRLKELEARELEGLVLGLWANNNNLFIELSKNILDKREAIAKAIEFNQLAIFDIAKGEEITFIIAKEEA
jgi:hypothetical protein